jgi:hypothetical protein
MIWYAITFIQAEESSPLSPEIQLSEKLLLVVTVFGGLIDIIVPGLICVIIYESSKVRLTYNSKGEVRFMRAELDSEGSSEEELEPDHELEEWLNDGMARTVSFERKMDAKTNRDSLTKRGAEWTVAGAMT